jgi:hypothetical protein
MRRTQAEPKSHSGTKQYTDAHDDATKPTKGVAAMTVHVSLGPLVSLIAGILILVMPRLLNFIVAIYLIVIGLIGLFGMGGAHF